MCPAGLIDCDVHISDDDVAGGQGVGGTRAGVPLPCNSCPTPVEQMDTHRRCWLGWISPGCACEGINVLT